MIVVNATAKGEHAYEITIGQHAVYKVSAYDVDSAIDILADYLESHKMDGIYITESAVVAMAECSKYYTTEIFARVNHLSRCGANGIYLEITSIKGCPNG